MATAPTYSRPTFEQLRARIEADLAALPAVLREPLAAAWARACHGEHGHIEWLYDQMTPVACSEERLQDWADLYGVQRLLATKAVGKLLVTGSVGAVVLKDALWRGTSGVDYVVDAAVTLGASQPAVVDVTAKTAGAEGNLPAGASLTLVDPLAGVAGTATADVAGLTGGSAQEAVEDWRARIVGEWETITTVGGRGGRVADYAQWARAAHPSVSGALVRKNVMGIGTLVVYPVCNGLPNRLPSAAVLSAVQAYMPTVAPVMPDVYVSTPTVRPVAVTIHLQPAVDTAANRAAIVADLQRVVAAEVGNEATLMLTEIDAAIMATTSQYTRQAPTANIVCAPGELLGTPVVTFV